MYFPVLTTKFLELLWEFLSCTTACTAELSEDMQLYYMSFSKFFGFSQWTYSTSYNTFSSDLALQDNYCTSCGTFWSYYDVYCKSRSNHSIVLTGSFQMFQWYCDRTAACPAHLKLNIHFLQFLDLRCTRLYRNARYMVQTRIFNFWSSSKSV